MKQHRRAGPQARRAFPRKGHQGQALVEYMMAVILCIGISVTINNQLKSGIGRIWKAMAKDIVPGCPGCTPPEELTSN